MNTWPVECLLDLVSGFLHTHMASHNRFMSYFHQLTSQRRWYHHLPNRLTTIYMRVLVAPIQHTVLFFKTHLLLSFHLNISSVPIFLEAFIFALQSYELVFIHNCTLWTACNFERRVLSFLPSLTPGGDRACFTPVGVWVIC